MAWSGFLTGLIPYIPKILSGVGQGVKQGVSSFRNGKRGWGVARDFLEPIGQEILGIGKQVTPDVINRTSKQLSGVIDTATDRLSNRPTLGAQIGKEVLSTLKGNIPEAGKSVENFANSMIDTASRSIARPTMNSIIDTSQSNDHAGFELNAKPTEAQQSSKSLIVDGDLNGSRVRTSNFGNAVGLTN